MADLLRRLLVLSIAAFLSVLVATEAVIPAAPFDGWTTVRGEDDEVAGGEHALAPRGGRHLISKVLAAVTARGWRVVMRPELLQWPTATTRWREARLTSSPIAAPDRSPPGPDRAPPST